MGALLFKLLSLTIPVIAGGVAAVRVSRDAQRLRDRAGDRGIVTKVLSGRAFSGQPDSPLPERKRAKPAHA